ncbi:hypothetical protein BP5796_07519 [Coleophoma crateriformis]|uniref:Serine aminopeptidase S33 domain-containing protein n=1 Tax=Coleophoma crateriformis TaxID=565419 RepID=A0A3D8RJ53_9HELO|nr:hypothetical protein BP5796_07519 [Coleophoma crateriformis]
MTSLGGLFRGTSSKSAGLIIGTSVATTLAILLISRRGSKAANTILSPRATQLPSLSKEEQAQLPYPPDAFPGARDVESPFGTFRCYEFGPEIGKKVVLVHGISTPCLSLGPLANELVERGCRVILLDLWGRGYSDGIDLPLDSRQYTSQILLAVTTSPLPWTGVENGFSLIGYSLGGGIAADFAHYFPDMVRNLVLLAPAGLIRPYHFGWQSKLMYSGWVPEGLLLRIVKGRLKGSAQVQSSVQQSEAEEMVIEQAEGARDTTFADTSLSKTRPGVTVGAAVQWQVENHQAFVRAFVSSIQHSSISGRADTWKKLGFRQDKVLIIAGSTDPVIVPAELEEDAKAAIGDDKVEWLVIEGGHEFPITAAGEVTEQIRKHWRLEYTDEIART